MFFLALLILFLVIGSISASDDCLDSVSLETNEILVDEVVAESSSNEIVGDSEENILENNDYDSISDGSSVVSAESSADDSSLNDDKITSSNENVLSNSSSDGSDFGSSDDSKNLADTNSVASVTVKYPSKVEYTQGKIDFKVKVGHFFKYGGNEYLNPLYGSTIKMNVYSGTTYETYTGTVDLYNGGILNFKLPSLALGTYKIEIFVNNI